MALGGLLPLMRTHDSTLGADHSTGAVFAVSVTLLAGFFGLLVAAAHPGVALGALAGGATALALRRVVAARRRRRAPREAVRTHARADDVT